MAFENIHDERAKTHRTGKGRFAASGAEGVLTVSKNGKTTYLASIRHGGKNWHVGSFEYLDEAVTARKHALDNLDEFFAAKAAKRAQTVLNKIRKAKKLENKIADSTGTPKVKEGRETFTNEYRPHPWMKDVTELLIASSDPLGTPSAKILIDNADLEAVKTCIWGMYWIHDQGVYRPGSGRNGGLHLTQFLTKRDKVKHMNGRLFDCRRVNLRLPANGRPSFFTDLD